MAIEYAWWNLVFKIILFNKTKDDRETYDKVFFVIYLGIKLNE